jgi:hypothetical protein
MVPHDLPDLIPEEITESDEQRFFAITSTELTPEQIRQVLTPETVYPRQQGIMALHWHPEFVPMELIEQRISATFPNRKDELIIPTQHNILMSYGDYSGVEVDCYSRGFNRKVQLLLHLETSRLERAGVLKAQLAHTRNYRSSQLFDFIHTIINPVEERLDEAAGETGADAELVGFVRIYVKKLNKLLEQHLDQVPQDSIKNKLLRDFFNTLRPEYGDTAINRAQAFLKAVKEIVKRNFSPKFFYRTSEIIEEARGLGAGVVIPHPEQFWPILLADYDVDGYEVWNPQSWEYTDFLITVLNRKNREASLSQKRLLVFMGDDTHMSEKTRPPHERNHLKVNREIGVQPPWSDLAIRKKLVVAHMDKRDVMQEYRARLAG